MNEKRRKFAFHYYTPGCDRAFALTIEASTKEEAIERVQAMSQAIYDGEIFATIPVMPKYSWMARLIARLRQK